MYPFFVNKKSKEYYKSLKSFFNRKNFLDLPLAFFAAKW